MGIEGSEKALVLAIDDDELVRQTLKFEFRDEYRFQCADGAKQALAFLATATPDVILLDVEMPELSGLELLKLLKQRFPELPVIMLSGVQELETVIEAMKRGAADYIVKGRADTNMAVRKRIAHLLELRSIRDRAKKLEKKVLHQEQWREIVGTSRVILELQARASAFKGQRNTVLITGESGSGKELVACLFHRQEGDPSRPFIAVNCGAIPKDLAESELFGHEKGAFTHAVQKREGKFIAADGGDLFLDEVGELPEATQRVLLRVLEDKKVTPVGSNESISVDVRVIAGTNRDLKQMVREGKFREDLYYRLAGFTIQNPSLRDRKEDIPALVSHFLKSVGGGHVTISKKVLEGLSKHDWPGNIRELRNTIERAYFLVIARGSSQIEAQDIQLEGQIKMAAGEVVIPSSLIPKTVMDLTREKREAYVDWMDRYYFEAAFTVAEENKALLAQRLKVARGTIHTRLQELGIGQSEQESKL